MPVMGKGVCNAVDFTVRVGNRGLPQSTKNKLCFQDTGSVC
ncbi:hypothetical protein LINGRAHAP2_LOCUS4524, partial [Linum grandiflorum]